MRFKTPLTFFPNGTDAVGAAGETGLKSVDLQTGKSHWEKTSAAPVLAFSLSPRGTFGIAESNGAGGAELLVISMSDGREVGRVVDSRNEAYRESETVPTAMFPAAEPISDDGSWLIVADRKSVRIFETPTAKAIFEDQLDARNEELICPAFERDSLRFAGLLVGGGLAIYAKQGDGWSRIATLPNVLNYRWTQKGLLFATQGGIHIWQDTVSNPLFLLSFFSYNGTAVFFAADGNFVAVQTPENHLLIRAIPSGDTILDTADVGGVRDVQFQGALARVLSYESRGNDMTAVVTEYDLRTGKKRKTIELEVVARLTPKGFFSFGFGGGWTSYRSYNLGPHGLFATCLKDGTYELTKLAWDPDPPGQSYPRRSL